MINNTAFVSQQIGGQTLRSIVSCLKRQS